MEPGIMIKIHQKLNLNKPDNRPANRNRNV